MKITIENVRGFSGRHELSIRPLTILIGENSTGKTTLLSSLFAVLQPDFPGVDGFNRSPFEMGSYDTIATFRGGKYGRADYFSLGWESAPRGKISISTRFVNYLGSPRIHRIEFKEGGNLITADLSESKWIIAMNHDDPVEIGIASTGRRKLDMNDAINTLIQQRAHSRGTENRESFDKALRLVLGALSITQRVKPEVIALSPIRSRPKRTYDQLVEDFRPEGDHIPLVLARALASEESKDEELKTILQEFGTESGLFAALKVRKMGRQPGDPFQIRVKSNGPDANLVDVGYGVSQALPVVIDSMIASNSSVILIQQPEVHLHPKAQASLGTYFATLASKSKKSFVIETHSDYLLDRVRQEVARGAIRSKDVSIIFLSRRRLDTIVHELSLDDNGNIIDAPAEYRAFFLQEEMRLLMRGV